MTCSVGWRWMETIEASWCVWKLIWVSWNGNFSGAFECAGSLSTNMTNCVPDAPYIWLQLCWCSPRTYRQQLSDFITSAFICPFGHQVERHLLSGAFFIDWFIARRKERWVEDTADDNEGGGEPHLAKFALSPNRVARIINLYINFPADRKRHVDMSSVSHGDWSWVRWDGRGRKPRSLAAAAIPVNSHILFSLPGSERVSFPRLAREGVWHGNRIRSEVTRCFFFGIEHQQTFLTAWATAWLRVIDFSRGWVATDGMRNYHKLTNCVNLTVWKNMATPVLQCFYLF